MGDKYKYIFKHNTIKAFFCYKKVKEVISYYLNTLSVTVWKYRWYELHIQYCIYDYKQLYNKGFLFIKRQNTVILLSLHQYPTLYSGFLFYSIFKNIYLNYKQLALS